MNTETGRFTRSTIRAAIETLMTDSKLKLFKNDITPDGLSEVEDFDEADYVGYADIEGTVGPTVGTDPATNELIARWAEGTSFAVGAIVGSQLIYGWYLTNTAGTGLVLAKKFDTPILAQLNGQVISVAAPEYRCPMNPQGQDVVEE